MKEKVTINTLINALKGEQVSYDLLRNSMTIYLIGAIPRWCSAYFSDTELHRYEIETMANEVFVSTFIYYSKKPDFEVKEGITSPVGVFQQMFMNKARNAIKKRNTYLEYEYEGGWRLNEIKDIAAYSVKCKEMAAEALLKICQTVIPRLKCSPLHKEILQLFFGTDMKYEQIDFKLELRNGTAKSVLNRNKMKIVTSYRLL